jgi:hypothetical protein
MVLKDKANGVYRFSSPNGSRDPVYCLSGLLALACRMMERVLSIFAKLRQSRACLS